MLDRGQKRTMASGDWLTDAHLQALTSMPTTSYTDAYSLVRNGKPFVIGYGGEDFFQAYAFDRTSGELLQSLQSVIEVLGTQKSSRGMAFWFGSLNSCLRGRQPEDIFCDKTQKRYFKRLGMKCSV